LDFFFFLNFDFVTPVDNYRKCIFKIPILLQEMIPANMGIEEVIPASWRQVEEVSEPMFLGFRRFSTGGKKKRE